MASDKPETVEMEKTLVARVSAAAFYGIASFLIIVANKIVLTSYKFPSFQFLGVSQMVTGLVVLGAAKLFKIIDFLDPSPDIFRKIWPLPLIYFGNLVCGLGGTKKLNLPMFTVLRRFSILFTLIAESLVLGTNSTRTVKFTVFLMIAGAIVAGLTDLAFDMVGYVMILINDVCTAANMVYTKQKLEAKELGKYGLLFYNSLFMLIPMIILTFYSGDFDKALAYTNWYNPTFLCYFGLSCILGNVLNYAIYLCSHYNSALTTTIIGVLKNLIVTYFGMFLGGDYIFSWPNFIGLNISVLGSLIYTYVTTMFYVFQSARQFNHGSIKNGKATSVLGSLIYTYVTFSAPAQTLPGPQPPAKIQPV